MVPKMNKLQKTLLVNRKASHDYSLHEFFTCGIMLTGLEVKAVANKQISIAESYIQVINNELWIIGCNIVVPIEADRTKKLLANRAEINRMVGQISKNGYTLIPTEVLQIGSKFKIVVALAKGKKKHDKRAALKEKAIKREQQG